jgi:hypothetical protein
VVGITLSNQQDADARGCNNSVAVNASQGRCLRPSAAEEAEAEEIDEEEEIDDE